MPHFGVIIYWIMKGVRRQYTGFVLTTRPRFIIKKGGVKTLPTWTHFLPFVVDVTGG